MTYSEFIDRVGEKVRINDDWPDIGSATQYQIDLSYIAALAVASVLPLSSFESSQFTTTTLTNSTFLNNALEQYDLPADVFRYRDDLGIASVKIDDLEYGLDERQPLITIRKKSQNAIYKNAKLFNIDGDDRRVYVTNAGDFDLRYLAEFAKPTKNTVNTVEYPLKGTDAERAAAIVSTHVNGERKRDNAAAQFQALLQNQYARPNEQAAAGQ